MQFAIISAIGSDSKNVFENWIETAIEKKIIERYLKQMSNFISTDLKKGRVLTGCKLMFQ